MTRKFASCPVLLTSVAIINIVLWSSPLLAQTLTLPDLPAGCSYTENRQQPMNSVVKIPAATPLYSEVGETSLSLITVGVQCEGPIAQQVSFGVKDSGTLAWKGPGQDILATNVPGIGVRLMTEAQSAGSQCQGMGTIRAGNAAGCRISREGEEKRQFTFSLKAQLIKISHNTPIESHRSLRLENGGAVMLGGEGINQQSIDIMNSGLLAPVIATEASCTLVGGGDRQVMFGNVHRPPAGTKEITLGSMAATRIEVACSPLRDSASNNYNVAITFTAGELHSGDTTALATSIDDLAIRYSTQREELNWLKFGEKVPMNYDADHGSDKSHFVETFYWWLRYMPAGKHTDNGAFNAVATYTISIQ
ncbi:fimbrial protein [Pantoea sp. SOD02]|uniref:fimbrial protein n=1 Tax=Pantoea sp. SOD02 TaxID=2970818 RepID=UPI002157CF23|nr:fimbrial protein [Pantoea sp. SOD02]UVC28084.1 fimbrial protein [Pantoea sp. SOD02]